MLHTHIYFTDDDDEYEIIWVEKSGVRVRKIITIKNALGLLYKVTQSLSEGRLYTTRNSMVEQSIKMTTKSWMPNKSWKAKYHYLDVFKCKMRRYTLLPHIHCKTAAYNIF